MKRYLIGKIHKDPVNGGTDKAFYLTISRGHWNNDPVAPIMWVAKSLCKISEPNDVGWSTIKIPEWLFTKNRVDYHRIMEVNWGIDGTLYEIE